MDSPMRKKFQIISLVLTVLLLLPASSFAGKPNPSGSRQLVTAYKRFSFQLFQEILKTDLKKNIFISPTSVALALSMTYNGAAGETQKAMARVLGFQGMSLEEVNRANASLKDALLSPDPETTLKIANSLWGNKQVKFKQTFVERNEAFYGAHLEVLDFANPQSASVINAWVNRQTEGKIPEILKATTPSDLLILINAIYFKGKWHTPFDKAQTKDHPFTLLNAKIKNHAMMFQKGKYLYYRGGNYQAVRLLYKSAGRKKGLEMHIFLPDKGVSLQNFSRNFTYEEWERWRIGREEAEGRIGLPRFELSYGEVSLKDSLKNLGMGVAFCDGGKANFRQMTAGGACIGDVLHKTFVKVNEEGTEAAAVTGVIMIKMALRKKTLKTFEMIMDRPFFFVISDTQTGTILFMGSIVDPL
jgi:serine protease inhibitor